MRRSQAAEHPTPCRGVRGARHAAAFTLIEMLVVVLIISILLALGIGSINLGTLKSYGDNYVVGNSPDGSGALPNLTKL